MALLAENEMQITIAISTVFQTFCHAINSFHLYEFFFMLIASFYRSPAAD